MVAPCSWFGLDHCGQYNKEYLYKFLTARLSVLFNVKKKIIRIIIQVRLSVLLTDKLTFRILFKLGQSSPKENLCGLLKQDVLPVTQRTLSKH